MTADLLKVLRSDLLDHGVAIDFLRRDQASARKEMFDLFLRFAKLMARDLSSRENEFAEAVGAFLLEAEKVGSDLDKIGSTAHNLADHHYRLLDRLETHLEKEHPEEEGTPS